MELQLQGRDKEARVLSRQIPIMAGMTNSRKERMGVKTLIESGANLSEAVKEYGKDWLKS